MKTKKAVRCPKCEKLAIPIGDAKDGFQGYFCLNERCGFAFKRGS